MKKQKAFTLAELLVSILIISVILTLLAPVITKRAKENISINGGSSNKINTRLFIYNKSDSNCSEISGVNNSLSCNFTIPSGVNRINAIAVSGGGGGAGATQPSIEYGKKLTVANATPKTSKTQELTITSGMSNVTVNELIGSGAGGGGASWAESNKSSPQSQADCDPFNAMFIPAAYNGTGGKNLCATKYNVGDPNGPTIASSVTTVSVGSSCVGTQCCWTGKTADSCTDDGNGDSSYSGCTRTVCNKPAADMSCSTWAPMGTNAGAWRLPNNSEISSWGANLSTVSKQLGTQGLQLCDGSVSNGSHKCANLSNGCLNAQNNTCKPQLLWSNNVSSSSNVNYTIKNDPQCLLIITGTGIGPLCSFQKDKAKCICTNFVSDMTTACCKKTTTTTTKYNYYKLNNGTMTSATTEDNTLAISSRCVLDGSGGGITSNTVSSGGGGGAGAYIKNYQIPNDVISSNIGGKIKLFSAAGGSGGNSASSQGSSASNGSNGNTSYIEIYDKDNVLKWGIRALGGNYGYGASSTDYGNGGAQTSANSCQLYENGVWKSINCTGVGIKGTNGNKVESASSTNTATGGSGGGSMYNSSTVIGGGSGGSISSANGYNGSVYGAGGGGATIVFDSSNNVTKGIGGNGANGVAEITYDLVYSAAAGGGGGGGAYVELSDISVSSGNTYTIKVGNGGSGGSISTKGSDGGESEIVFDSITYTLSGGKGGQIGTSATSTTNVIQGIGGSGGIVSSNVSDTTNIKYKNGSKGEDGGSFTKDDTHSNSTNYGGSYGGVGGVSGIDTKGSCSGLFIDSSICSNTTVNGITNTFVAPIINNTAIDYGQAGAGGGGGGWSENTILYPNPGSGSQGQGGYVFIYWRE